MFLMVYMDGGSYYALRFDEKDGNKHLLSQVKEVFTLEGNNREQLDEAAKKEVRRRKIASVVHLTCVD